MAEFTNRAEKKHLSTIVNMVSKSTRPVSIPKAPGVIPMDKQAALQEIYENALADEFQKIAGDAYYCPKCDYTNNAGGICPKCGAKMVKR